MTYKYITEDNWDFGTFESAWENDNPKNFHRIAIDAAEYEMSQEGCWKQNGTRQFYIFREDGYMLGSFNVKYKSVPNFRASEGEICSILT